MTADERWVVDFSAELERREVSPERIRVEIDSVKDFIEESNGSAEDTFGDPGSYAANLAPDSTSGTPGGSTVLALLATIATFIVFTISSVRWITGGDSGTALWSVVGGFAFIASNATLSILLARNVVASALRDDFTKTADVLFRSASTLVLLVPWLFIVFAGVIVSITALG